MTARIPSKPGQVQVSGRIHPIICKLAASASRPRDSPDSVSGPGPSPARGRDRSGAGAAGLHRRVPELSKRLGVAGGRTHRRKSIFRNGRRRPVWIGPGRTLAMARAVFFVFSLYFILIQPSIPGPKTELLLENSRRFCSVGSGENANHVRCNALLHTKLRSKLECRGGQGEDISELEEMPTFTPAPRLVGTKECPPEEIISTFHTPALKKDILVKT